MAGAGYEIQGEKPMCELGTGFLKDCPDARVNMVAAMVTGVSASSAELMKLGNDLAVGANKLSSAILNLHDPFQAGMVIWKFSLEMLECVFHGYLSPYEKKIAY